MSLFVSVRTSDLTAAARTSTLAAVSARILPIHPEHPEPHRVHRAAALLAGGGLIAFPTDSFYGLGCDLGSRPAIDRLYRLRGLDRRRPLSIICGGLAEISRYAKVSNFAFRALKRMTPGPFTFILESTREVPEALETRQRTVGIRIPNAPIALALVEALGRPIVSTSAAGADGEPLIDPQEILETFGHGLDLIVDAGCQLHEPSTVLSLVGDEVHVLRQGKGEIDGTL